MANKRMFSKKILQSDAFFTLKCTAQLFYIQLNLEADDDGFVNNSKMIMRMSGATESDLQQLISLKFVIQMDDLLVIKHWKIHNYIPADRYHESTYKDMKDFLDIDENGAYREKKTPKTKRKQPVDKMYTDCIQNEYSDKIRLDKIRIDKNSTAEADPDMSILNIPEAIKENFDTFLAMRKEKKKPITTDRELKLLFNRLQKLSEGRYEVMNQMLENAILSKWTSVFELKPEDMAKLTKKKKAEVYEATPIEIKNPLSPEEQEARIRETRARLGGMFQGGKA